MVYFIEIDDSPYVKVGRAKDVKKRLASLATSQPFKLNIRHVIKTPDEFTDSRLEKQIHAHLKKYRMRGEWFELPHGELTKTINYFETGQAYALNPIFDGHILGLRASVQRVPHGGLQTVTEPCFFCHKPHWHGAIDSVFTVEGSQTYGHRSSHCAISGLTRKHPSGQVLNNSGYYLWIENPEHEAQQRKLLSPRARYVAQPEYINL